MTFKKVNYEGGIIMYGDWMKKINTDLTQEDIKKYEENKKNN